MVLIQGGLYMDTRYMHKEMSDARHLDLQITLYEREMKFYERRIDQGGYNPTLEEKREYNMLLKSIEVLGAERNKIIGLDQ